MKFICVKCKKTFKVENNIDVLMIEKAKHEKKCRGNKKK